MAFWGCSFVYDGKSCDDFDLMLADADGNAQGEGRFASAVSIVEETSPQRWKPFFYGTRFEDKLQLTLVCTLNNTRLDAQEFLSRQELDNIATWLTGHSEYKWLTIDQEDLSGVRYECIVTELSILESGNEPYGIFIVATCDGPYAYRTTPTVTTKELAGETQLTIENTSSHNGYFKPVVEFEPSGEGDLTIVNNSDNGRAFTLTDIPGSVTNVRIDSERCLVECDQDIDLYGNCNFKFLRLKRGDNDLKVTGNGTLKITCDYPINPGC